MALGKPRTVYSQRMQGLKRIRKNIYRIYIDIYILSY